MNPTAKLFPLGSSIRWGYKIQNFFLTFGQQWHNADEPQPKKINTEKTEQTERVMIGKLSLAF